MHRVAVVVGSTRPARISLDVAHWARAASLLTWSITGGARGAAQFRQVLQGLHMTPAGTYIETPLTDADVDAEGQLLDAETTFGRTRPSLHALDGEFSALLGRPTR
ncbi:hypothetical protein [Winogradskya humida]|uniref:NADPH-dependent FMN reductase n=1 Tax=Winogradskya humida TaxID=113566 RepID=A0ABQ4A2L1_9ACTN|nr:hypothetical protein [Actinoplanes humidus]GIE25076.1 hypothetical protein Ahu01nite_081780 [Actinoplanes humidus]